MQEGIGRGGYQLLATLFVGLGVLGLVTTVYALRSGLPRGSFFDYLGIVLTLFGLAALYGATLWMLRREVHRAPSAAAGLPAGAPVFTPQTTPQRQIDFEFKVEEPAGAEESEDGPAVAVPMRESGRQLPPPPKVVLPPNRNIGRDPKGWPQRQGPSGITRGEWRNLPEGSPSPRAPRSITRSNGAMLEPDPGVPVIIARIGDPKDDPDWTPEGMARGKCGGCNAILLAPPERPIRLRCPKCEKETLLR